MSKKNKIFLFPLSLAVIFFASIIIIFSPIGSKNIITLPTPTPTPKTSFCGGIAGIKCPPDYLCKLDGKYPDAGGTCVKK